MSVVFVKRVDLCFDDATTLQERIAKIDTLIDSLLDVALVCITQGNIAEYEIDTGQTRNRVKYNSQAQIMASIDAYDKIRQKYINKLTPRKVRLVDSQNFRRRQ
jgi:tetrahydromethanopterin S-methyltransferase subunit B